ncbi:putative proteasome regulatory particle lid subunit [Clavispora lusitaniae]|uniref:26S proteasome complex subunit SEM1 n=1 Tax=Clavispora lusitaniae TaxID=36911 RepID=A0AA91PX75_CLALS|nr:putative proteasome regulatory particle lid subunit [Clavispora lusitaniae]
MSDKEEKIIKTLEEDDEFEDFPEDSHWSSEPNPHLNAANLWEEDWDDDDAKDDFSEKLRQDCNIVAKKKRQSWQTNQKSSWDRL